MEKISFQDFQDCLTEGAVRTVQIIYIAIASGATFFLAVVLFLYDKNLPSSPETAQAVQDLASLTMIHGAALIAALWLSGFLYRRAFAEKQALAVAGRAGTASGIGPDGALAVIRTARIIKLAVIEGPAFFGLVICFLGVTGGVIYREPLYWVNLVSYGV
ncbi:MAG TPA: hypothetical protein ENN21_06480 [Spirochaetes bacterium]|nr:hypothetical protein [Spirochaetota bacterium]